MGQKASKLRFVSAAVCIIDSAGMLLYRLEVIKRVVVVVHHDGERLAQDERAPHHHVAVARPEAQLSEARDDSQRRLHHHAEERPYPEHLEGHAHLK